MILNSIDRIKSTLESNFSSLDFYSIESNIKNIRDELEEINFYIQHPDGNFYEHKKHLIEKMRNPDSFHKLVKIEDELKKNYEV